MTAIGFLRQNSCICGLKASFLFSTNTEGVCWRSWSRRSTVRGGTGGLGGGASSSWMLRLLTPLSPSPTAAAANSAAVMSTWKAVGARRSSTLTLRSARVSAEGRGLGRSADCSSVSAAAGSGSGLVSSVPELVGSATARPSSSGLLSPPPASASRPRSPVCANCLMRSSARLAARSFCVSSCASSRSLMLPTSRPAMLEPWLANALKPV